MISLLLISGATCLALILSVLFFPRLRLKQLQADTYWVIALCGALLLILFGKITPEALWEGLTSASAVNPLKILVLFLSMTLLSIFLDELGFFRYLANASLSRAQKSQTVLFLNLYLVVSVLTVFTSNDIIVLTFTPFICYFAKNAKIDPLPYLIGEFVAANTWSMVLIIGNPTNIYLATGKNFLEYTATMLLPTVLAGAASLIALLLLFRRQLRQPMQSEPSEVKVTDKPLLGLGLGCLGGCIVMLVLASFLDFEMWLVSLFFFLLLYIGVLLVSLKRRQKPKILLNCLKRAPWPIIPFVLSMFVMVLSLEGRGVTAFVADLLLGGDFTVWSYGISSFLAANLVNNIPMSVLYRSIVSCLPAAEQLPALYASVVGSNLGAFFTPIGALAGIMWTVLLKAHGVELSFGRFVRYGTVFAVPALLAALLGLVLVL